MDSKKIKNFLLETVTIEKNRTLKKQLLYLRNGSIFAFLFLLWILYWATFNSENANIGTRIIFILTILLTITTAIFTLKKHQYQVCTWKIEDDSINAPYRDKTFAGTIGGIVTAIIILLYNNVNFENIDFSETLIMIFGIVLIILGLLITGGSMCISQHKLYLLKKYCPEIGNVKATD